jgi:CheY-like chemotaxis protein
MKSGQSLRETRVCLVDDDPAFHRLFAAVAKRRPGLRSVAACYSGAEALRVNPAALPDVVLMDLLMPGMDGAERAENWHQRTCRGAVLTLRA